MISNRTAGTLDTWPASGWRIVVTSGATGATTTTYGAWSPAYSYPSQHGTMQALEREVARLRSAAEHERRRVLYRVPPVELALACAPMPRVEPPPPPPAITCRSTPLRLHARQSVPRRTRHRRRTWER